MKPVCEVRVAEHERDTVMTPRTILVIEDERDIRDMICTSLRREGFDVRSSSSGSEGLHALWDERPDLLLTDYFLPDVLGVDIIHMLKSNPETRDIRMVLMTASTLVGSQPHVLPPDRLLHKPLALSELNAAIHALLP